MNKTETYYLIDYENTGSSGLIGCSRLSENDTIIIFFTKNSKKIDMSEIANHGKAKLEMIEIPAGKQSTDMHIGSYLGYFAAKYKNNNYSVVIVSKDSDFDNVIKFWKTKSGIIASRASQIKPVKQAKTMPAAPQNSVTKTDLNNTVMQVLSKAGYKADVVGFVASAVVKNTNKENSKQQIYRAVILQYGQDKGLNIYNHIKKYI